MLVGIIIAIPPKLLRAVSAAQDAIDGVGTANEAPRAQHHGDQQDRQRQVRRHGNHADSSMIGRS